ncbi:MAG: phosphatase PAP2 family protein [Clostridium sp.]|nr:phosphatase PAP2 family protein [Clostridium sp.]
MKEKYYIYITEFFRKTKLREQFIKLSSKLLPLIVVAIYFLSILFLILRRDSRLILFVLIPAMDFIFITLFRKYINAIRPYDKFNFTPVVKFEHGKGKSFPSRHTASAFIIAMACLYINLYLGIFMLLLAVLIGLTRIISGVHFIKDVAAGMFISIILGYICFFL